MDMDIAISITVQLDFILSPFIFYFFLRSLHTFFMLILYSMRIPQTPPRSLTMAPQSYKHNKNQNQSNFLKSPTPLKPFKDHPSPSTLPLPHSSLHVQLLVSFCTHFAREYPLLPALR